jgi:hypothetical protein
MLKFEVDESLVTAAAAAADAARLVTSARQVCDVQHCAGGDCAAAAESPVGCFWCCSDTGRQQCYACARGIPARLAVLLATN